MVISEKNRSAIGILDSGVGGLTVAKEVIRQLPCEMIYYLGDVARCPYGSRNDAEIRTFALKMIDFLVEFPLKALLIACNTVNSILSLEKLEQQLAIPVLGVIKPGARAAIRVTKSNSIGVLGTEATIRSRAYDNALYSFHPYLDITTLACPTFVPLVEQGRRNDPESGVIIANHLQSFNRLGLDTVILGCTHYPLLTDHISAAMGDGVRIVSSAAETASELSAILERCNLLSFEQNPRHRFFTTGNINSFRAVAEDWLEQKLEICQIMLSK